MTVTNNARGFITRTVTGVALAAAAAMTVLWSPAWVFAVGAFLILTAAFWEWRRLIAADALTTEMMTVAIAAIATVLFLTPAALPTVCFAAVAFWAVQAVGLWRDRATVTPAKSATPRFRGGRLPPVHCTQCTAHAEAAAVILIAWSALVLLRLEFGAAIALAALAVVWGADTGAYLLGAAVGKRKLAPAISAGKTYEGLAGGLVAAGTVAYAAAIWLDFTAAETARWLAVALVAALAGVVGDLHESRLKRRAGVKDSGAILPGHGGVLDRVDGMLAAAPVFAAGWWLAE